MKMISGKIMGFLGISGIMNTFFKKPSGNDGASRMSQDSNSSQIVTTSSFEQKMNHLSSPRRHIFDGLKFPVLQLAFCLTGPEVDRRGFKSWLGRTDSRFVDNPNDADVVIFTGGADVSPTLYDERILPCTYVDHERDAADIEMYHHCINNGIPMLGVCRGAQFLWVMQGGKLYQDVNNHNDGAHKIKVFRDKCYITSSSVHHQAVKPEGIKNLTLLATAEQSTERRTPSMFLQNKGTDFEIWAFRKDAILCTQGHPEYAGFPQYSYLMAKLIDEEIYHNPVTRYVGGLLRVTKEIK